ncbi:BPSS1780 family membrane protein [Endozoicomonas sp. Mp262]|uniref:BPSS1780 family membrane protein n=1 Tax=Endozoicomonas sp. Mp262 TaxID=2919499 RepID=UPI0021DA0900
MNYSLQLTGKTLAGFSLDQAKLHFSKFFKINDKNRVNKIFHAGKNVTIKKSVSKSDAIRYKKNLKKMGLECIILSVDGEEVDLEESKKSGSEKESLFVQANHSFKHNDLNEIYFEDDSDDAVSEVKSGKAGNGLKWIKEGIYFFKQNPVSWILALLAWIIVSVVVNIIPIIGQVAGMILGLAMYPGLMYGAYQQDNGNDLKVGDTFKALKKSLPLIGLCIVMSVVMVGGFFITFMGAASGAGALIPGILLSVVFLLLMMGYFFAGPLIVINEVPVIEAIKMSFSGSLKNIIPLTVFNILAIFIAIIGTLLLGVGLLVAVPVIIAGSYVAYRDIFLKSE